MGNSRDGGPAFPILTKVKITGDNDSERICSGSTGLTVRDYFAIHAPAEISRQMAQMSDASICNELGIIQGEQGFDYSSKAELDRAFTLLAKRSYQYADAMLREREGKSAVKPAPPPEKVGDE